MLESFRIENDELKKAGIKIITGEACNLSMRLLCELSDNAMKSYLEYTGINVLFENVSKSWESQGHYTVFLTWEVMEDLLIIYLLKTFDYVVEILPNENKLKSERMSGYKHLLVASTKEELRKEIDESTAYTSYGWSEEHGQYEMLREGFYDVGRTYYVQHDQPHIGMSNVHGFTGMHH